MAQYKHLPIYKLTYDLLLQVMQVTKGFPKDFKYTLGEKLKNEMTELVVLIYRANSESDRAQTIQKILERIQVAELMIRLAKDLRILSVKHYASLVQMTDSLAKQAQGWLKSVRREEGKPESASRSRPR